MSYDIDLVIDTGGREPVSVVDVGNYTCNVSAMWEKAIGFPLKEMHGMLAGDCVPFLINAVKNMVIDRDDYIVLEPENGWGDYEGARKYLIDLTLACEDNPKCTVSISY